MTRSGYRRLGAVGKRQRDITKNDPRNPADFELGVTELHFQLSISFNFIDQKAAKFTDAYQIIEGQARHDEKKRDGNADETDELERFSHGKSRTDGVRFAVTRL